MQCYHDYLVYLTICWNNLLLNYSNCLLDTINCFGLSADKIISLLIYLRDYTYGLFIIFKFAFYSTFPPLPLYSLILVCARRGLRAGGTGVEQNSSIIFEFNEAIYNIYELSGIVIWGSNLGSSLNSKKLRKAIREMFVLPHHYVGILVGLLLSDAGINKSLSNRLMRIAFVQSFTVHFYYFMHIYFSLQFIFRSLPNLRIQSRRGKRNVSLSIISMGLPAIHNLCLQFLDDKGNKIVPADIYNLLTPIALANWIILRRGTEKLDIPVYDSAPIVFILKM
uniref:Homing endonuclease LAGLIDADG domain-containing protein n=1 Tax=Wolfiporia cocos TaxID=81056 RepID=A0A7G7YDX8_9APHY|nr:hypothetical protein [Wolfiporia cocos]